MWRSASRNHENVRSHIGTHDIIICMHIPCNFDMILWMLAWLHGSNRQFFQEFYQMPPRNLQKLRRELALPSPKFRKNWNVIILFRRNMPCLLIYYIIITFQRIILIRILIMNKYIHSWHAFKECLNNEFLIIDLIDSQR